MNVVIRGLMAAAMAVYAAMHVIQAVDPPAEAPGWLVVAFALTAVAGLVLAGGLIVTAQAAETRWEDGAALLAGASLVALALSFTVGFLGVAEEALRADTAIVFVAELVTLASWVTARLGPRASDEVSEAVPSR